MLSWPHAFIVGLMIICTTALGIVGALLHNESLVVIAGAAFGSATTLVTMPGARKLGNGESK